MALQYVQIPPKLINTASLRAKLLNAIKPVANDMEKAFNEYVSTWQEHFPEFITKYGYAHGDIYAYVALNGWGPDEQVFYFLDHGTSVRYATMTEDFVAKTTPHKLYSGEGQGGLNYVDPNQPRPGIEAREISKEIADTYREVFMYRIKMAFRSAGIK